jgi:hypothetical protein
MMLFKGARAYIFGLNIEKLGSRLRCRWLTAIGLHIKDFVLR